MEIIETSQTKWTLPCDLCGRERVFKLYRSYKYALKLNNRICYRCALPLRKVAHPSSHIWERPCPNCSNTISYKSQHHLTRAIQENSVCRKCFLKKVKKYDSPKQARKAWYRAHRELVIEYVRRHKEKASNLRHSGDLFTVMNLRLYKLRSRAKKKGIPATITVEDLMECYKIQDCKCYYSGMPLVLTMTGNGDITDNPYQITVDRLDSTKGYEKGNIVLCCLVANSAKSVLSSEEFYSFVEKMYFTMKDRRLINQSKQLIPIPDKLSPGSGCNVV